MPVSARTYTAIALEDPEGQWELHRGRLREKPAMSFTHNQMMFELAFQLRSQLDPRTYGVRANSGRVRRTDETYYIPDVFVLPLALAEWIRDRPDVLEVYEEPLPLIVEVWSPSTGDYDIDAQLPEYQRRGDLEIWRLQPFERKLTVWRRQPDGSYAVAEYTSGTVQPVALPGVTIDLDALFA